MIKTLILSLLIFVAIQGELVAQSTTLNAIENHIELSKSFLQRHIDSSLFYSEKALALAKTTANDTLISKAELQNSSVLIFKNDFRTADSILRLNLTKTLPEHIKGQVFHNLGSIAYRKQDFDKAIELYIKAAQLTESSKNKGLLLHTYTNIGVINAQLKQFKNAQNYLEKAVVLADERNPLKLQVLVNLGNVYRAQKYHKKFESTFLNAEELAHKYTSKRVLAVIYNNLSNYYTDDIYDFKKALSYSKKAVEIKKALQHTKNLSLTYNNIAHLYLTKKDYAAAIPYLDSALPNSKGVLKSYIYNNYKTAYLGLHKYKKAMGYAELKDVIKDSLNTAQQLEKVAEITEKYASEKKAQEISFLNSKNELQAHKIQTKNTLLLVSLLGMGLLASLAFLWYKNQKNKESYEKALLQHKLLQTQLNPHFLFHSLNSIQSFIYQHKTDKSLDYISSYSKLMRAIFDSSSSDFISVKADADAMTAYLELQRVNLSDTTVLTLDIDAGIADVLIPPMFVQPYIENAIQHGIKSLKAGKVIVNYKNTKDSVKVTIFDNGKGVVTKNNTQLLEQQSSSKIIKDRIKNLQKTYNYSIGYSFDSNDKGTTVTLCFPKKK